MAARGLSARRFAAVEGQRLDMRMMLANGVIDDKMFLDLQPQSAWSWKKKANKFRRGQIGCMLSHISLWMQNSAQEKPYILVLEDDVQLPDNFTEVLTQIVDQIATTDFDIVQLSGVDDVRLCQQKKFKFMHKRLCQGQIDPRRTLQAQAYIQPARFSPGAWAYLIKVDQIPKILKHFSQPLLAKPTSIPENKSMAYWAPLDMVIWLLEDIRIGTWYPYVINREQTISFNEGNSATAN